MAFGVAGLVLGGLALAGQLGASISPGVMTAAELATGATTCLFFCSIPRAARRHAGETTELQPSLPSRLLAKLGSRR